MADRNLAPGGQYGAFLFSTVGNNLTNSVGLNSGISGVIYIINQNSAIASIIPKLLTKKIYFNWPQKYSLEFNASGNTTVVPRASLIVYSGKNRLAEAVFNSAAKPLFSGQKETFSAQTTNYKSKFWPGKVKLLLTYRTDYDNQPKVSEGSFWYIPRWTFLVLLLVLWSLTITIRRLKSLKSKFSKKKQEKLLLKSSKKIFDIKPPESLT